MNSTQSERVTLYYREGSSDKVYHASIEPKDSGFVVNFAYGRRGASLQTGSKTTSPIPFPAAKKIFDKIVGEKMSKGYTPGADGTPYQSTDKAERTTGILPQLLNSIEESEVAVLICDSTHCAQEKFDGTRGMIRKGGTDVIGINKKGLSVALPETQVQAAQAIPGDFVLDGESIGDRCYVFDLLELNGTDLRQKPYRERYEALMDLVARTDQQHIIVAEIAITPKEKQAFLQRMRQKNKEGVVLKRLDAPYKPGRPASGGAQLKHKFYATLSAIVSVINAQRSVQVCLMNGDVEVPAGNVTIPSNHSIPQVGEIVEIRYLYAFKESGCLYQPTYLGKRSDIDAGECTTAQFKFKGNDEEA